MRDNGVIEKLYARKGVGARTIEVVPKESWTLQIVTFDGPKEQSSPERDDYDDEAEREA